MFHHFLRATYTDVTTEIESKIKSARLSGDSPSKTESIKIEVRPAEQTTGCEVLVAVPVPVKKQYAPFRFVISQVFLTNTVTNTR